MVSSKRVLLLTIGCLLGLSVNSLGQEKRINVNAPFEGVTYSQNASGNILSIRVKLREVPLTDKETASTPLSLFKINLFSATGQTTGVVPNDTQTDATLFVYPIQVLSNADDPETLAGIFRLKPTWDQFSFVIAYQYAMEPVAPDPNFKAKSHEYMSPSFTILRSLTPSQEESPGITLPVVWSQDQSGKTTFIGVSLKGNDIRVKIDLKDDQNPGFVVASGKQLLRQGIQELVELQPAPGVNLIRGNNYTLEITSLRPGTTIAKNSQKTPWASAQPQLVYALEPTSKNQQALSALKANYTNRPLELEVSTTTSGTLKLVFDGLKRDPTESNSGTNHKFTVNLDGLTDGRYPVHFEGESFGLKFAGSSQQYYLVVEAQTRIEGITELQLDADNNLLIRYSLSREVAQSRVDFNELSFLVNADPVPGVKNRYQAKVSLSAASQLVQKLQEQLKKPENAQKAQVPVTMTITSESSDRGNEREASISLAAVRVNQAALVSALGKSNLSELQAKQEALTVLGLPSPAPNSSEDQAINYLAGILREKSDKKSKFRSFLKFAGKIAAGYVGIPIPL